MTEKCEPDFSLIETPGEAIKLLQDKVARDIALIESEAPSEDAPVVDQIALGYFAHMVEAKAEYLRRLRETFPGSIEAPDNQA